MYSDRYFGCSVCNSAGKKGDLLRNSRINRQPNLSIKDQCYVNQCFSCECVKCEDTELKYSEQFWIWCSLCKLLLTLHTKVCYSTIQLHWQWHWIQHIHHSTYQLSRDQLQFTNNNHDISGVICYTTHLQWWALSGLIQIHFGQR